MTALREKWTELCRQAARRMCFAEPLDKRVLLSALTLLKERTVSTVTLVGDEQELRQFAKTSGVDLSNTGILFHPSSDKERLNVAADLLYQGTVDAVLAGNMAVTADVIRAGISGIGLARGVRTVSGSFIMNHHAGRTFLYADCGVVIAPTARQLADIAVESVKTWKAVVPDSEPVVAFLSFSTAGSASHESLDRIREGYDLFKQTMPEVESFGEIQFDAAFDAQIGAKKAPGSTVPGRANCFVFPDLNSGNIAYKITQRLAGFEAYGPILQGLAKPYSDLSRGATVEDIVSSAMVNLIRAGSL